MGLQAQLMPRFGAWACTARNKGHAWETADEPSSRPYAVKSQADAQHFAVAYRTPMTTFYSSRFVFPQGGGKTEPYDHEERAFFQALVLVQAGVNPLTADLSKADDWGHWPEGAQHFALGMRSNEDNPSCGALNFGCGERRVAFLASRGRPLGPNEHPRVKALYPKVKRVWDKFQEMKRGAGEALERSTAGTREFDFNIDGLAHYGMLPDMLQDAFNQLQGHTGGAVRDLHVLMRSAEDYIRAWEAIESSRK